MLSGQGQSAIDSLDWMRPEMYNDKRKINRCLTDEIKEKIMAKTTFRGLRLDDEVWEELLFRLKRHVTHNNSFRELLDLNKKYDREALQRSAANTIKKFESKPVTLTSNVKNVEAVFDDRVIEYD